MGIKEVIEKSPVMVVLSTMVVGFLAGLGAYRTVMEIARLDAVPQGSYISKEDLEKGFIDRKDYDQVAKELSDLRISADLGSYFWWMPGEGFVRRCLNNGENYFRSERIEPRISYGRGGEKSYYGGNEIGVVFVVCSEEKKLVAMALAGNGVSQGHLKKLSDSLVHKFFTAPED